jgi:thymidylate synthase (FAD)
MELVNQRVELWDLTESAVELIERAGRKCYKSEHLITETSANGFVRKLISRGHLSVLEHAKATVCWYTNRGVTHELVRHRIASYSQESTRYVNYGRKDIQFIKPVWVGKHFESDNCFVKSLKRAEDEYKMLLQYGWRPEQAREVLPNALKTEIVATYNFSMWRHVLKQRTAKVVHPQTRDLMLQTLKLLKNKIPVIFEDIELPAGAPGLQAVGT